MPRFALSAVGADRPGIVAAVTGALVDHGCNLEDTSMSILRGQFAMMLVVAGPEGLDAATLEEALATPAADLDLVVAVRSVADEVPAAPEGEAWAVAVYGADRPGIVHRVTSLLAGEGANIVDLSTRVIGEPDRPVYAMILEVCLPPGLEGAVLTDRLGALARELGVECSAHLSEADIL
ncbi:MAG TPA: ACT domain-containing protein [Acidimicrobiales bacterium]|nr:ACT domain-containing protein [Acidimicrobiales bacterium]